MTLLTNIFYIEKGNKQSLVCFLISVLLLLQMSLTVEAKVEHLDSIHPVHCESTNSNSANSKNEEENYIPESLTPTQPISSATVEDLTRSILRKELELERLNTLFRQKTTLTSKFRQRRMFAYGFGNACITEASLIEPLPALYQIANEKSTNNKPHSTLSERHERADSPRLSLIANSYGAGGDLLELSINFIHYLKLRKQGFVPSMYRQRIHKLHAEIDTLIAQRSSALHKVNNFSEEDRTVAAAEGKLLNDLRDLYLLEYVDYHAACKRFWLVQNGAYLTDLAKNVTGGAGNIISLQAYHLHQPYMFGGAGLLTLISGAIILVTPLIGRVTGNISGLTARRIVSQEANDVHASSTDAFSVDYQKFLAVDNNRSTNTFYSSAARERRFVYEDQEKIMLMRNRFLTKERKEAHNSLVENVVFAGIVGPTKMTNGILTMIAGWDYPRVLSGSKLYAAAATAYIPGAAFAAVETARLAVQFEWSNWKLRNSELLPSNQFKRRLLMLDNMDSFLGK